MKLLTQENIGEFRENEKHIIYASAQWCGPWKMLGPVMEKISEKYNGINRFTKNLGIGYIA